MALCERCDCAIALQPGQAIVRANEYGEFICDNCEQTRLPEYCPDYECENCIGMIEHGCYCQAMGAAAPGGPLKSDETQVRDTP